MKQAFPLIRQLLYVTFVFKMRFYLCIPGLEITAWEFIF